MDGDYARGMKIQAEFLGIPTKISSTCTACSGGTLIRFAGLLSQGQFPTLWGLLRQWGGVEVGRILAARGARFYHIQVTTTHRRRLPSDTNAESVVGNDRPQRIRLTAGAITEFQNLPNGLSRLAKYKNLPQLSHASENCAATARNVQ